MSGAVTRFDPAVSPFLQPHPKLGHDLMEHLWQRLDAKYPAQWRACFKGDDGAMRNWKEVWAESFEREGLTLQDIKLGLNNVGKVCPDFPPNEAQFIRACRLRVKLDAEAALLEAIEQLRLREEGRDQWSHPAIYWAAVKIGAFELRNATWSAIRDRWTSVLNAELARGDLPPVPEARPQLPEQGATTVTREQAQSRIAALKAMLRGGGKLQAA